MTRIDKNKLTKRTNLIISEGQKRGFRFKVLDYKKEILVASKKGREYKISALPEVLELISSKKYINWDDKDIEINLMSRANMRTPSLYGVIDKIKNIDKLDILFPAVVKPVRGSLSKNVFAGLETKKEIKGAAKKIFEAGKKRVLIEEFISGKNYRILTVQDTYIGCVMRKAANVTGDGKRTIGELIEKRNREKGRGPRDELNTTNHKIVFNESSEKILKENNLDINSILPKGKNIEIQNKIIASLGADYIDYTDKVHKSIIKKCLSFNKKHKLFIVGYDVITDDISIPLEKSSGAFNEFNLKPYIDLNENNNIGKKRPASKIIWDKLEEKWRIEKK